MHRVSACTVTTNAPPRLCLATLWPPPARLMTPPTTTLSTRAPAATTATTTSSFRLSCPGPVHPACRSRPVRAPRITSIARCARLQGCRLLRPARFPLSAWPCRCRFHSARYSLRILTIFVCSDYVFKISLTFHIFSWSVESTKSRSMVTL